VGSVYRAMDMCGGTPVHPRLPARVRLDGHLDPGDVTLRYVGMGTPGDRGGPGDHRRGCSCGLPRYPIRPMHCDWHPMEE